MLNECISRIVWWRTELKSMNYFGFYLRGEIKEMLNLNLDVFNMSEIELLLIGQYRV